MKSVPLIVQNTVEFTASLPFSQQNPLYALVTGIVPPDAISRVIKHEGMEVLKLAHLLTPTVPEVVARAIDRVMSLNVDTRFATVAEFWWALAAR